MKLYVVGICLLFQSLLATPLWNESFYRDCADLLFDNLVRNLTLQTSEEFSHLRKFIIDVDSLSREEFDQLPELPQFEQITPNDIYVPWLRHSLKESFARLKRVRENQIDPEFYNVALTEHEKQYALPLVSQLRGTYDLDDAIKVNGVLSLQYAQERKALCKQALEILQFIESIKMERERREVHLRIVVPPAEESLCCPII